MNKFIASQAKIDKEPVESRLTFWLSWAVLLAGIASGIASLYIVVSTYSPLPQWDEWSLFDHLAKGGGRSLTWLAAQHNEHRILTTRFLFLIDVEFFRGKQTFLLFCVFLTQLLNFAMLSWSLRSLAGRRGSLWRLATGLIAYCILCPTQYENLVWGFEMHFVLTACMATLAILGLLLYQREGRTKFLAMSIVGATLATWSLANGMLLWPLLIATAWWLQMGARVWRSLLIAGASNVALYFYGYHRPGSSASPPSITHSLHYIVVYFGSSFVRHSDGAVATIVGTIGVLAALVLIVGALRHRDAASPLATELALLMLFTLATAAITSTGRVHLGVEQATASRYQTFALLFWCCLGLALLRLAEQARAIQAFGWVLLVAMIGFATQVRLPLIDAQWRQLRLKRISLALLTGVEDDQVLADAYPDPQAVLRSADYMRQHRLSIFAGRQYEQLGAPVDMVYRVDTAASCSGSVSSSENLPAEGGNGLRLTGYAWDNEGQRPARDIVAVKDGRIAGFGSNISIPLAAARASSHSAPSRFGWIAFVRNSSPGKVQLFAILKDGDACPFAEISQ